MGNEIAGNTPGTPISSPTGGIRLLYLQQELILPEVAGNNRCWQFARQWTLAGHHVTFITGHHAIPAEVYGGDDGKFPKRFTRDGIDVHVIKTDYRQNMGFGRRLWSFISFFRKAKRLVERQAQDFSQCDAVLGYSAPLSVGELGRQLSHRLQKPFFFEVADVWPDVPIGMGAIRSKWIQNWLYRRTLKIYDAAARVFTFSDGMRDQVLSHGVDPEKVMTVPNGINVPEFSNDGAPLDVEIEKNERMKVFYTGTLGTINNVGQLVRAMKMIEDQGRDDIECVIVGRGNEAAKVESLAEALRVRNVTFVPRVPRTALPSLLKFADVGISTVASFPVLEHNAATKFYDYLSSGIPVVINHEGWQADYLRDNDCGLSCSLGSVEGLAKNLCFLADHPDKRTNMGANAKASAKRDFDREKWAINMIDVMVSQIRR